MPLIQHLEKTPRNSARRILALAFAISCFGSVRAESTLFETIWSHILERDINVITVTDFTEEGKKLPEVSPERPAYFEALILGYNDWGRSVAGERIPDKKLMIRMMFKVLADHGYYPATKLHKPSLVLAMAWGSMNQNPGTSLLFMGGDKLDLLWELDPFIGGMLDPRVLLRWRRSGMADMIMDSSTSNLYVASIQAFDEAAAQRDQTVLLWHTKISCPATGLAMDSSLRTMIRLAGPNIGRETPKPVLVTEPEKNAKVEIGELKVLEMIDPSKLPITDRSGADSAERNKAK